MLKQEIAWPPLQSQCTVMMGVAPVKATFGYAKNESLWARVCTLTAPGTQDFRSASGCIHSSGIDSLMLKQRPPLSVVDIYLA